MHKIIQLPQNIYNDLKPITLIDEINKTVQKKADEL